MGGVAKLNRPNIYRVSQKKRTFRIIILQADTQRDQIQDVLYLGGLDQNQLHKDKASPTPKSNDKNVRKMATPKKFCLALKERGLRRNNDEEGAKNTMGDK